MSDTPELYSMKIIKITHDVYPAISRSSFDGINAESCKAMLGISLLSTDGMSSLTIEIKRATP